MGNAVMRAPKYAPNIAGGINKTAVLKLTDYMMKVLASATTR